MSEASNPGFLRQWLPLSLRISMPRGTCEIIDAGGKVLASMHSDIDLGPTIPVPPHLTDFAQLFVSSANEVLSGKKDSQ